MHWDYKKFAILRFAPFGRTDQISLSSTWLYNSLHEDRGVNYCEICFWERNFRMGGRTVSLPNFGVFSLFCSEWNGPYYIPGDESKSNFPLEIASPQLPKRTPDAPSRFIAHFYRKQFGEQEKLRWHSLKHPYKIYLQLSIFSLLLFPFWNTKTKPKIFCDIMKKNEKSD